MFSKQLANDWVAALRSGEYKQCVGDFHNGDDEFCAVGVLYNEFNPNYYELSSNGTYEWCGPDAIHDLGFNSHFIDEIMDHNDRDKWTFERIADAVERHINAEYGY